MGGRRTRYHWSKAKAHRKEPEGYLFPVYNLPEAPEDGSLILLVEGEKTADAVRAALSGSLYVDEDGVPFISYEKVDAPEHPWAGHLRAEGISHVVTWRGGAAEYGPPEKTDWSYLNRSELRFIFLPDDDDPSYAAMKKVRDLLSNVTDIKMVNFNLGLHKKPKERYGVPRGWDFADKVPMLAPQDDRLGPAPLTWGRLKRAMRPFGNVIERDWDSGTLRLKQSFANTITYVESTEEYWFEDSEEGYSAAAFNKAFSYLKAGIGSKIRFSNIVEESSDKKTVKATAFRPGGTVDPVTDEYFPAKRIIDETKLNVFLDTPWEELKPKDWKVPLILLSILRHILPERRDRQILVRAVCTVFTAQKPDDVIQWGILTHSDREGTGKTMLARMVEELYGDHNRALMDHDSLFAERGVSTANKLLLRLDELKEDGNGYKTRLAILKYLGNYGRKERLNYADEVAVEVMYLFMIATNFLSSIETLETSRRLAFLGATETRFPMTRLGRWMACRRVVGPYRKWEYPDSGKPVDQRRIQFNPQGGWMKFAGWGEVEGVRRPTFAPLDPSEAGLSEAEVRTVSYIDQDLTKVYAMAPDDPFIVAQAGMFFGAAMPMYRQALRELKYLGRRYGARLRRPVKGAEQSWFEQNVAHAPRTLKRTEAVEQGMPDWKRIIRGIVVERPRYLSLADIKKKIFEDTGRNIDGRAITRELLEQGYVAEFKDLKIYQKKINLKLVPSTTFFARPDLAGQASSVAELRIGGLLDVYSAEWEEWKALWEDKERGTSTQGKSMEERVAEPSGVVVDLKGTPF